MGCWNSIDSVAAKQALFQRLYQKLRQNDVLNNPQISKLKRKEFLLFIYYSITAEILQGIKTEITKMQNNVKKSQVKVVSLQKMAQFVESMNIFWNEVVRTKNAIKDRTIQAENQLNRLNDQINRKIRTEIQNFDNNNPIKSGERPSKYTDNKEEKQVRTTKEEEQPYSPKYLIKEEKPLLIKERQSFLLKQQKQRLKSIQCRSKFNIHSLASDQARSNLARESKDTNNQLKSNQTYSLPLDVMEMKEREQQQVEMMHLEVSEQLAPLFEMKSIMQNKIIELDYQLQKSQAQNKEMSTQIQHLNAINQKLQAEIQSLKESNEQLNDLNNQLIATTKQLEEIKYNNNQLIIQNRLFEEWNSQMRRELQSLRMKSQKMERFDLPINSSDLHKTNDSVITQAGCLTILKYFGNSALLPNYQDHPTAIKLRESLTKLFPSKIISTKLIYAFDPLSQLHFDTYIQNRQNLFVLIKLQKQIYIGGFTGEEDENQEIESSFLFSISPSKEPIKLTPKTKVKRIDYEQGFINFGHGQIKIKCRSLNLTCNVAGICNAYFAEGPISIQRFLGSEERSCQAKGYQIYEIQFDHLQ